MASLNTYMPFNMVLHTYLLRFSDTNRTCHIFLAENDIGMGRSFGISNISLVITYTTVVIAALMLAGFLWMAFAYSGQSSSGYGRKKREAFNIDEGTYYVLTY